MVTNPQSKEQFIENELQLLASYFGAAHQATTNPQMSATLIREFVDKELTAPDFKEFMLLYCGCRIFALPCMNLRLGLFRQQGKLGQDTSVTAFGCPLPTVATSLIQRLDIHDANRLNRNLKKPDKKLWLQGATTTISGAILRDEEGYNYVKVGEEANRTSFVCPTPGCLAKAYKMELWIVLSTPHNHLA